jgi:hypothetical protein
VGLGRRLSGGAEGIRTPDLVNASHALCQLSYSPSRFRNKWYEIDFDSVKKQGNPSFIFLFHSNSSSPNTQACKCKVSNIDLILPIAKHKLTFETACDIS